MPEAPKAPKAPKADDAPPPLFDVKARRRALARSRGAFGDCSFLHARILEDVHDRLRSVNRSFATAAFFGRWPEGGPAELSAMLKLQTTMDFSDGAATAPAFEGQLAATGEEEWCPLAPESVDLIVSLMSLHAANDPPGALAQLQRALKPDGLLIAAALGGDSLAPLRSAFLVAETDVRGAAAPRVAPMADARAYGGLLQRAGFALPVTDVDRVVVRYADGLSLLRDLKAMGETNVLSERSRTMLRRDVLARAMSLLAEGAAAEDGRFAVPFEVVFATGWAPHESQQKPLKPGAAAIRLSTALGVEETSAGEKARS